MPWAEQQPNGTWRAGWRNADGKRRYKSGFAREALAKRYAGEQETKARRGDPESTGRSLTWAEWRTQWKALRVREPATEKHDEARLDKWVAPKWGGVRLNRITHAAVQAWVNDLARDSELSPSTVRKIYYLLSASMKAAVKTGQIAANPCRDIELPTVAPGKERFLTRAEFDAILYHLDEPYATAAILLVATGCRFGELAGLHWQRVDLEVGTVTFVETWDAVAKRVKPYPKTKKPVEVPLVDWALEALVKVTPDTPRAKCGHPHAKGSTCRSPLVLQTVTGLPLNANTMRNQHWNPACEAAGVGHARLHDARHSFASWLAQAGVPLQEIQALLGHGSIITTQRYSHLGDTQRRRVLDALQAPEGLSDGDQGTARDRRQARPQGDETV